MTKEYNMDLYKKVEFPEWTPYEEQNYWVNWGIPEDEYNEMCEKKNQIASLLHCLITDWLAVDTEIGFFSVHDAMLGGDEDSIDEVLKSPQAILMSFQGDFPGHPRIDINIEINHYQEG